MWGLFVGRYTGTFSRVIIDVFISRHPVIEFCVILHVCEREVPKKRSKSYYL